MRNRIGIAVIALFLINCGQIKKEENSNEVNKLSEDAMKVRDYVEKDVVIAHRGTTYWAPEETEPAFRWARNIGADYLELDLQMTKDNFLIALHDDDLSRTTNVAEVYPDKINAPIIEFTLKELRSLDAGSWFNVLSPDRTRESFAGLKILTFEDVVKIAEGYRINIVEGKPVKRLNNNEWTGFYEYEKDPGDNGNRPGIYAETKKKDFEEILANELKELGWNVNGNPKEVKTVSGKVGIANTNGRFVLQSFSPESIQELEKYMPGIPKCQLLEKPEMIDSLKETYIRVINFAVSQNVHFIGSSIAGEPNNYEELTAPWMVGLIHESGMFIHPYTFDTNEQLTKYGPSVEGLFTNRADLALKFHGRLQGQSAEEILLNLGY
jgi:glycerophosphoryl diester phosphodiesterase